MKEEKNIILEGIFQNIPNPHHHHGRIYPTDLYLNIVETEFQKKKQELRLKKLNRLLDELE